MLNRHRMKLICLALLSLGAVAQTVFPTQPTTPEAQLRLGNDYLDKKDYSSAMTWFRKAAERNNSAAENNIGWLYENGFGVKQDYAEAMNWFRKPPAMPKLKTTSAGCTRMAGAFHRTTLKR